MNWTLESVAGSVSPSLLVVSRGSDEPEDLEVSQALVDAALEHAHELAKALGPRLGDVWLTVAGHEGQAGEDGFAAGHVQVTVSRLNRAGVDE